MDYGYDRAWASGSVYYYEFNILGEIWRIYFDTSDNKNGVLGIYCNIPEFVSYYSGGRYVDYRLK